MIITNIYIQYVGRLDGKGVMYYTHTHMYIHTKIYINVYTCVCVCVCCLVCVCVCVCVGREGRDPAGRFPPEDGQYDG